MHNERSAHLNNLLGVLIVVTILLASAALYESNPTSVSSAKMTPGSTPSIVPGSGRILGVNGYPGTAAFASSVIGQYDIKWLRVPGSGSALQQQSYLTPDGYNYVGLLNSCSTSATLAAATQCYQIAVTNNPDTHVWELFNEPNNLQYQGGFQNGSPYNAYLLTKAAYQVIKAHNPGDYILAPSISIYTYVSGNDISPTNYAWVSQYWSYGAGSYVSYVSLHEYPIGLYSQVPKGASENNSQIISAGLDKYEALTQKPIWITETGCNVSDEALQTSCLQDDYSMLFSKSYVQGIFWYELSDHSNSGGSQTTSWGLFGTSNQPKIQLLGAYELFNARAILDQFSALSTNLLTPYAEAGPNPNS